MQSSAYYYKQMQDIVGKQDTLTKKGLLYQEYCEKLVSLYNDAVAAGEGVDDAGKKLSNGGYISGGNIPYQEDYISGTKLLSSGLNSLAKAIGDTNSDIREISRKIESLNNKFNIAQKNYKAALKRENS